jgi:hypothetical protein
MKELTFWENTFLYLNMILAPWRYLKFKKALRYGQTPYYAYKWNIKIFK